MPTGHLNVRNLADTHISRSNPCLNQNRADSAVQRGGRAIPIDFARAESHLMWLSCESGLDRAETAFQATSKERIHVEKIRSCARPGDYVVARHLVRPCGPASRHRAASLSPDLPEAWLGRARSARNRLIAARCNNRGARVFGRISRRNRLDRHYEPA